MPVYIYDKDAFKKIMTIEGGGFRQNELDFIRHQHSSAGACSFWVFYQMWQEMYAEEPKIAEETYEWGISVDGNGAIYGLWGWNRYTVRNTGEICFIRGLARAGEDIKKAEELGFRIFP